jgi:hypothetical protein
MQQATSMILGYPATAVMAPLQPNVELSRLMGQQGMAGGAMFSPSNQETGNAASDEQHLKVNAILLRDP